MRLELEDRVAVITGAARGLGRAIGESLAAEGAKVVLVARSDAELGDAARAIREGGGHAIAVPCDVTEGDAPARIVEAARALGPVAIFVHAAAALFPMKKLAQCTDDEITQTLDVDARAALRLARAVLDDMLTTRHGRIVFVGSVAGSAGSGASPAYALAKAGLTGLAKNLAIDYGRFGVTANVVEVAFAATERFFARTSEESRERFARQAAARRIAEPREIADVVTFLASARASYINGAVVPVTGGADLNTLW
jgi:NAD(P)-dependent dehydrogenase (short-subunit alcohol dehydrogenase family)